MMHSHIAVPEILTDLAARGRLCFRLQEIEQATGSSASAIRASLRRLQKKGVIAMPARGFYVIVPPEFRALGCLPAEQFIPELMSGAGEDYYAGLLTASEYHGAAHQRPQAFQVVVAKPRRPLRCGKVRVEFVYRKNAARIPVQSRNTPAGILNVSSPEATAFDLVGYPRRCAGLDNVATVISELAEKIESARLREAAVFSPVAWAQRLGYLLDAVGAGEKAGAIFDFINETSPVPVPLVPSRELKGARLDKRWRILVNANVEPDR